MNGRWKSALAALGAVIPLMHPGPLWAESQAQTMIRMQHEIEELSHRVEELEQANHQLHQLDQQVKAINRKAEIQQAAADEKIKETPVVRIGERGFLLESPDDGKSYRLRVGGFIQTDGRFYLSQTKPTGSEFLMRRVRPILEGTVGQFYDFRIMPDFGEGTTVLYDAYADIHYLPQLRARIGKFKPGVGLERLQSAQYLKFVERALPTDLVPNRDVGVELHGDLFQDRMEYQVGVFNQIPDNTASVDAANGDAKDFAARVYFHPFANPQFSELGPLEKLGLGISGTYGDATGNTIDSYKSAGQFTFFKYNSGVAASGSRYRYSPQADWYWRSVGLLGEYVENSQRIAPPAAKAVANTPRTISTQGWQLQASYLLTGEDETYGVVKPRRNFDPLGGGSGAWELVARGDQLLVDNDVYNYGLASKNTSANEALEWSVGINWYLNYNVKFQLDYENTTFRYGAGKSASAARALTAESAVLSEFQVSF